MKNRWLSVIFFIVGSLLGSGVLMCQIRVPDIENSYRKVFVETDNFGASYLQQLEDALPEFSADSIKFSAWNDLAYYWHTRNLNKALEHAKSGFAEASAKDQHLWEGRFQITLGAILLRMEKLDSARIVLENARPKVIESDLSFLYTQLGYVYERKGRLDLATDYAQMALKLSTQLHDIKGMALAYSDLSNIFWKQAKYKQALEYGLESLRLFEKRGIIDLDYDFTLYVTGNNYVALNEYEAARKYFEHAIAIGERYGFYNNLSDVYISLVELNSHLKNYEAAELAGANALKYAQLLENNFMIMRSWLAIGKLQNLQGKYISSIESLKQCIAVATVDFGDEYYLSQAYETLGKSYAGNHNYQLAYQALAKYDMLKNEIFTAESDERTSLLQTEFHVAEKDNTILLQKTQIQKQKNRQTLIIIVTGLLFLYLVLLYQAVKTNRRKNALLQKQNEEKEFLLKEIHHRVKNNLEIVSSLLALQSSRIHDPKIAEALQKSQQRVHSISMIHQKLYQGKSLSTIEMKDYFEDLGSHVLSTFGADDRVHIVYTMKPTELDVDQAVPIGLIVNELLTNAMKYAFPGNSPGQVVINFKEVSNIIYLSVSDNGVGRNGMANPSGTGFGTQLIQLLTQQLDGKMHLSYTSGMSVSFEFQQHKAA
jgi:two-component sensor histidine kinase